MSTLNVERAKNLLSSASSVMVHSGNVASWNKLRRKGVLTPTDEVSSTLSLSPLLVSLEIYPVLVCS